MAEQIRTGLESTPSSGGPTLVALTKKQPVDQLDVVSHQKTARQHVREFGCVIAIVSFLITGSKLYHGAPGNASYYWFAFGSAFLFGGYLFPRLLLPVWTVWMKFANGLGMVMSTIIVSIAWALMFFPVGILFKIIGKRVMDLSFRAPVDTYWETRDEKLSDFKLLERQF